MKKLFVSVIFIAVMLLLAPGLSHAANQARNAAIIAQGLEGAYAIGDVDTGRTAQIDAGGNVAVNPYIKSSVRTDGDGSDVCSGAAVVHGVILVGDASSSAGDYVYLHDAATATGAIKLDVSLNAAKGTTAVMFPGGIEFSTGVSLDAIDGNVSTTIIYGTY